MEKNKNLKALIQQPGIVVCAGVYDAVSARIAQEAGFSAIYMTGNGTMASLYGFPDLGIATMTDMHMRAHQISNAISIPLLCDCDNGYGNVNNVAYAVREYERLGASGVHIEDQGFPKKCGAMDGVSLISAEEMADKIRAAVKARKDKDFLICARTDCNPVLGIEEVIRRCRLFSDAGADFIYPEMVRTREDILKVTHAITNTPILYDHLELSDGCMYSVKELENMGIKMVFNPLSAMFAVCYMLKDFYKYYQENGNTTGYIDKMVTIHEYEQILGINSYN